MNICERRPARGMARTSDEMRALVGEFIRVTGISYEDQTEEVRKKSGVIEWQYRVGTNVIVSKNANRADRIHLNINMRFAPGDAGAMTGQNPAFARAVMEVSEVCTVCGVGHQWVREGGAVVGLAVFSHVDEEELGRARFHDAWDNVARVTGHVQKVLRANLGRLSQGGQPAEAPGGSMYG